MIMLVLLQSAALTSQRLEAAIDIAAVTTLGYWLVVRLSEMAAE